MPCLALPPPAVTLRWLAFGLPLRDCRLRSRYTPGRLGFFNSPCLALPCLALPCLALPCLSLCPLSMAGRSTRRQVALGETPPVGSFDRGWGHLKVCSPSSCSLFFSLRLSYFPCHSIKGKDACPPYRRGRRHNRSRPRGCPPSLPLPLLCSCLFVLVLRLRLLLASLFTLGHDAE